jgi:hypothetical protein
MYKLISALSHHVVLLLASGAAVTIRENLSLTSRSICLWRKVWSRTNPNHYSCSTANFLRSGHSRWWGLVRWENAWWRSCPRRRTSAAGGGSSPPSRTSPTSTRYVNIRLVVIRSIESDNIVGQLREELMWLRGTLLWSVMLLQIQLKQDWDDTLSSEKHSWLD